MKQIRTLWLISALLLLIQPGFGHGRKHKKKAATDSTRRDSSLSQHQSMKHGGMVADSMHMDERQAMAPMPAPLDAYPTYHPMVVHVPISMLLLAALLQLVVLLKPSGPLNWITLLVAAVGTVGAYVAGTYVHPHTDGLSDAAQVALETHETYADYTIWLGLVGTLLKGITLLRPLKWLEGVAALALVGAGIAVGLAGHQGGALTYLYGIGPRGAYLEQHEGEPADGNRHEHKQSQKAE